MSDNRTQVMFRPRPRDLEEIDRAVKRLGKSRSEYIEEIVLEDARRRNACAEAADDITPEQIAALRPLLHSAYRGLSIIAIVRHQLLGDSLEAGAAGDVARSKAALALHSLLGPPARIEPSPNGGRWELVLADCSRGWSHEPVEDDDDQDGPESPDSPPAPRPAARQEQEAGT